MRRRSLDKRAAPLRSRLSNDTDARGSRAATARERPFAGNRKGLTLIELIVAFTIMLVLATMAVPLARAKVRAERERELRYALREMRTAIDKYQDACAAGFFGQVKADSYCYPESLEILVEGQKLASSADEKKMKFLRRIPRDPFTGKAEWGLRSEQDDPKAMGWGGQNVFDVYTKTTDKAPDGTAYSDW